MGARGRFLGAQLTLYGIRLWGHAIAFSDGGGGLLRLDPVTRCRFLEAQYDERI